MPIAVKICDREELDDAVNDGHVNGTWYEMAILRTVGDHSSIIKLLDTCTTELYSYMIFEYADGGDLRDYCKQFGPLCEDEARHIFKQLLQAVEVSSNTIQRRLTDFEQHLHSRGIIHCGKLN